MTTTTELGYTLHLRGDQPLEALAEFVKGQRENNTHHPVMDAKRYELVAAPAGMNLTNFQQEFLQYKAEDAVVYISIVSLETKKEISHVPVSTGKVKTTNNIVKGARKWSTQYVVYTDAIDENGIRIDDELFTSETKGDAMDFARAQSMATGKKMWIKLEKRLVGSDALVAVLNPEMRKQRIVTEIPDNLFAFFGKGSVQQ